MTKKLLDQSESKTGGISTLPSAFVLCLLLTAGCSSALEMTAQQSQQPAGTTTPQLLSAAGTEQSGAAQLNQPSAQPAAGSQTEYAQSSQSASNVSDKKYYVDNKVFLIRPVDTASTEKIAMLTFDDGPKGDSTHKILDTLDKYNAKAVWFVSGFNYGPDYKADPNKADTFKELVLDMKKRGHVIGSHTWEHGNLKQMPTDKQRKEIDEMNKLLESITGDKPKFIRPPFGSDSDVLKEETKKQGMQWMNWSVGSLDWEYKDPQQVVKQTVSTVYNGANILMHDNEVEVQALDSILQQLTAQGYKFVVPTEVRSE